MLLASCLHGGAHVLLLLVLILLLVWHRVQAHTSISIPNADSHGVQHPTTAPAHLHRVLGLLVASGGRGKVATAPRHGVKRAHRARVGSSPRVHHELPRRGVLQGGDQIKRWVKRGSPRSATPR